MAGDEDFEDVDESALRDDETATAAPQTKRNSTNSGRLIWSTLRTKALADREPANAKPPDEIESHIRELQKREIARLKQEHGQRKGFFVWAMIVVTSTLAGNFTLFGLYIKSQWGHIDTTVMVAWISATVVEVLGIAYIIATHLFSKGDRSGRGADNRRE